MIAYLRLLLLAGFLVPLTAVLIVVQFVAMKLGLKLSRTIPVYWHSLVIRIIGLRVTTIGTIPAERPLLIVANHVSWTDIPVLASIMKLCFIAKREVDEMPGVNILARLQRTVYVEREARSAAGKQAREITARMLAGDAMVLFAEGTTGDGNRMLEFKSSLFGAAQYAIADDAVDSVLVQPVSIAYTRLHGIPMGRYHRAETSWPGDVALGSHALNLLLKAAWDVEVSFGKPVRYDKSSNRRKISGQTEKIVREMYVSSLNNRSTEPARAE